VNTSPEDSRNLIGSIAMDNHRSWVLRYEFYSGGIKVVEIAERIRVDEPKDQGFAKNVTTDADLNSARHLRTRTRLSTFLALGLKVGKCLKTQY
jgi:hypothetical protein